MGIGGGRGSSSRGSLTPADLAISPHLLPLVSVRNGGRGRGECRGLMGRGGDFRQRVSFGPKERANRSLGGLGGIHNTNLFSEQRRDARLGVEEKTKKTKELVGGGSRKKGVSKPIIPLAFQTLYLVTVGSV